MSRHIIDHARNESDPHSGVDRLRSYIEIERRAGMHPAISALRKRPAMRGQQSVRLEEYARIARGEPRGVRLDGEAVAESDLVAVMVPPTAGWP